MKIAAPTDLQDLGYRYVLAGFARRLASAAESEADMQSMRDELDRTHDAFVAFVEYLVSKKQQAVPAPKPQAAPPTPPRKRRPRKPRPAKMPATEMREAP